MGDLGGQGMHHPVDQGIATAVQLGALRGTIREERSWDRSAHLR